MNQQGVLKRFGIEGRGGLQGAPTSIEGRFRIESQIGYGAFGKVYRAVDVDSGENVAVKIFDNQLDETGYLQELGLLFSEEHPNLVRTLSFGYAHGRKYIVYEFVRGGSLRDFLIRCPRPSAEVALHILREVCLGLEFAHSRRVVHRDLKPENLLLTSPDMPFSVKLCDFGLSARFKPGTKIKSYFGSPAYMAPEQFGEEYDHRVDIYAAGIIAYEMLFGQRPHTGDAASLRHAHTHVAPAMPLAGPPVLLNIISRLIAKAPELRYARAGDVVTDIDTALQQLGDLAETTLPAPTAEEVVFSPKWSIRLDCPCVGYQTGAVNGTLFGLEDCIVSVNRSGAIETLVDTNTPVAEFVEGGDPDGIFAWVSGRRIWVWDHGEIRSLDGGCQVPDGVRRLRLSPDGSHVVVAGAEHVDLVETRGGTILWRAEVATYGAPPEVCFSDDGMRVWVASESPRTQLICLSLDGEKLCRTAAPGSDVSMVAASSGGVVVGSRGRRTLTRLSEKGFATHTLELAASLVELHPIDETLCAAWSHKHVELIDRHTLASYALVNRPDEHERLLMAGPAVTLLELETHAVVVTRFELERQS
jgi:serine/threonine-protein kinase